MAYTTERINNKSQATLSNEQLIEGYIGNEENTLKRTNLDENPDQTYIDKINAKYDAELKALENNTTNETKQSTEQKQSNVVNTQTPEIIGNQTDETTISEEEQVKINLERLNAYIEAKKQREQEQQVQVSPSDKLVKAGEELFWNKAKPKKSEFEVETKTESTFSNVEATAKAFDEEDATFVADLSDGKLSVDEKKQSAKKQIKDNGITNGDASYALMSKALEEVDGLSVNNIFDLAKRIAKLDNKPILINHIAEAIQYEVSRVKGGKDTFSLSIDDAKNVLLNLSKDAEPAKKTRMNEIGIAGKSYRDRINKLKVAKKQYETLNENDKALIKSFLNRFNDAILEDAKFNTDEYLQLLLDLTKSDGLVDVAENIQNAVRVIDDKYAIELQQLPPVKEPLKNKENTEEALKRFSSQQLSEISIYNRDVVVKMIDAQLKKTNQNLYEYRSNRC